MQSLNIFMHKLLDYAGLFPPAKLPLLESLINYAAYTKHAQKDWLGRYILPCNKISASMEIILAQNLFKKNKHRAEFSIILNTSENLINLNNIIAEDVKLISEMHNKLKEYINIDSVEFCPPKEAYLPNKILHFHTVLELYTNQLTLLKHLKEIYIEIPFSENINEYVDILAKFNSKNSTKFSLKLRTGGVTPAQIPSAYHVAQAIRLSAEHLLPLKATAGLHVPIPNDNPEVGARLHGFLNIFSCLLLCYDNLLSITEMENIILNYSYSDFNFTDKGLSIGNKFISNDTMNRLRNSFIKSFGTCSFLEPIEHLHENNFL